jgi:hypothetical protein
MGLDTEIHLRNVTPTRVSMINVELGHFLPRSASCNFPNRFEYTGNGAAEFQTLWRYWSPAYDRGPWPLIHTVIHVGLKFAGPGNVYYGSDGDDTPEMITAATLCDYNTAYLLR